PHGGEVMRARAMAILLLTLLVLPVALAAEQAGSRYAVILAEEMAPADAAALAAVYGGSVEPGQPAAGGRTLVVRMLPARAAMLRHDPHVVSVSEQGHR